MRTCAFLVYSTRYPRPPLPLMETIFGKVFCDFVLSLSNNKVYIPLVIYLTTRFFVKIVSMSETIFPDTLQKTFSIVRNWGCGFLGESSFGNEGVIFVHPLYMVSKASRSESYRSLSRYPSLDFPAVLDDLPTTTGTPGNP